MAKKKSPAKEAQSKAKEVEKRSKNAKFKAKCVAESQHPGVYFQLDGVYPCDVEEDRSTGKKLYYVYVNAKNRFTGKDGSEVAEQIHERPFNEQQFNKYFVLGEGPKPEAE